MKTKILSPEVQLESKPCPLCAKFDDEVILTGHDRLHNLPGEFTVVKCRSCGLMRTNPRPTPETISFYYPDDYGPYKHNKIPHKSLSKVSKPLWKRLIKRLFKFEFNYNKIPSLSPGQMLEVGCASGKYLNEMANQGWKVEGIEFSEKAAKSACSLGYKVYTGALETAPEPEQKYDLVVGWMVLEHLHEPILGLKKLHSWVKPGGWLAISVPNAASWEFSLFKDAWYALHLPNHLYHYTPPTLKKLLEQGGWKMTHVLHHRFLDNFIASLGYLLQDQGHKNQWTQGLIDSASRSGKKQYWLYPLAYPLSLLGQTGGMTVWAQKIND